MSSPDFFSLRLPATSANLGAAFDTAAVALDLHLSLSAIPSESFSIHATGLDVAQCTRLEGNLILDTYGDLLRREGRAIVPLAITMDNQIPLGMGCGSSAAGRLAAITMANHFGHFGWKSDQVLAEACALEGHPDNAAACWLGGLTLASEPQGMVHAAHVPVPEDWRAIVVSPGEPLATSHARAVLPSHYARADTVANIQAAALLGIAFAQGRGDLLRPAMQDRIHQPFRAEMCTLLPLLLPLAGSNGILGAALSGAGPSVLIILSGAGDVEPATAAIHHAIGQRCKVELRQVAFENSGAVHTWNSQPPQ